MLAFPLCSLKKSRMGTEKGQRERDLCCSLLSVGEARWPCEPGEFQTEEGGK